MNIHEFAELRLWLNRTGRPEYRIAGIGEATILNHDRSVQISIIPNHDQGYRAWLSVIDTPTYPEKNENIATGAIHNAYASGATIKEACRNVLDATTNPTATQPWANAAREQSGTNLSEKETTPCPSHTKTSPGAAPKT